VLSDKSGGRTAPLVAGSLADRWGIPGRAAVVVPSGESPRVADRGGVEFFCWSHVEHMASTGVLTRTQQKEVSELLDEYRIEKAS
jgi:hypothetical protein